MSYLQSVPKEVVDALTWLGKKRWLVFTSDGFHISEAQVRSLIQESQRYGRRFANEVASIFLSCSSRRLGDMLQRSERFGTTTHLFVASQVLCNGPKTVLLSQELCEAFEQTDINIPFREYRQPFETMIVELPRNYGEKKFVGGTSQYPTCLAVHHTPSRNSIIIDVVMSAACVITFMAEYDTHGTIDAVVEGLQGCTSTCNVADKEKAQGHWVPFFRIALNAMLAMTYGIEGGKAALTPQQRRSKKALQKRATERDKFIAHRARLHLAAFPTYFQFDQKVKAFGEQQAPATSPTGNTGPSKKPHWRRGHWRWQAVGKGRQEREMIWIRPILIRADRFGGDLKDTTTTYTT